MHEGRIDYPLCQRNRIPVFCRHDVRSASPQRNAVRSCITLTVDCDGKHITTIEGLQDPLTGALDPIQQAFLDKYAFQCGYCTPGIIMATKALLDKTPHPDDGEIKEALSGNFCRCISQYHVFEAIGEVVGKVGK